TVSGNRSRRPLTGTGVKGAGVSLAKIASRIAQQSTVRASGPIESRDLASGTTPSFGTRRAVGFQPTIPLKAAGTRHEPPVSVPSAPYAMPSATETPEPDDEPPGTRRSARDHGDAGVP